MELAIGTKTDEEAAAWLRVIQLFENKGAARAATAWIKSKNSQGARVSFQDMLNFLEEYHAPCNYRRYVDGLRMRHIRGGYGWPGKAVGELAVSRHPNIVVELICSFYWLRTISEFAYVSEEVMATVIEDNEELGSLELYRFARSWNVPRGYLWAPTLQVIDPTTNKGKKKRRYFLDLLRRADGLEGNGRKIKLIHQVRDAFEADKQIPYGWYRWACIYIAELLEAAKPKPKITVRTLRAAGVSER